MYSIRVQNQKIRDDLQKHLLEKQIFSKVYFKPIHKMEFYKNQKKNKKEFLPMTEKISNTILTIPLYPNMTIEEKDYLTNSILEFFEDVIN